MKYKISVIIAMYNTEEFIEETLYSIINQEFDGVEIIIVDDGSNDNSISIVKELQKRYAFIKLYEQANQGPSVARNLGMSKALGKYIMFLDSDDLFAPDALNNLYTTIEKEHSDVVIGSYRSFSLKNPKGIYHSFAKTLVGLNFVNKSLDDYPKLIVSLPVWNKIYRKSFLDEHDIKFFETIHLREDACFMAQVFASSDKISHIPFDVCLYRIREASSVSLTHVINPKVFEDILYVSSLIDTILEKRDFTRSDEINKRRYITELIAINYRFEKFLQEDSEDTAEVLETLHRYLAKIEDDTISIFSFNNRILLFLLKYGHFDQVKEIGRSKLSLKSLETIEENQNSASAILLREQFKEINTLKKRKSGATLSIKKQTKNLLLAIKKKSIKKGRSFLRKNYIDLLEKLISFTKVNEDIWLIGERLGNATQDTSWQFFVYCREQHPDKKIYFVTKEKNITQDIASFGNVLAYGSFKHTLILLAAQVHIFNDSYRDLCIRWDKLRSTKRVEISCFLQHGVIAMSKMQGYYNYDKMLYRANDVDIFITSSEFEKDIVIRELGHPKTSVYVTGLSRFDTLFKHAPSHNKKIVYMPTWRNWLKGISEENFLNSEYFKESLGVIEMLTSLKKRMDVDVEICFHHALDAFTHLYNLDESVEYVDMSCINVQSLILDASLLITDYSSISFDFAYLQKPVIFYQFDTEDFLEARGGSFIEYDTELFGDKISNLQRLEEKTIDYIENTFMMFDADKTKANRYFDYHDDKNCERIFTLIEEKLDEKRKR